MMCVMGFHSFFLAAAVVHGLQVAELHEGALESLARHRAPKASANAALKIPGAFENATDKEKEEAERRGVALRGNETHSSAHAAANRDSSASNMSAQIEYTISTPTNSFLFLKMVHTADEYTFYKLDSFTVKKGWRPTPKQNHFLWYAIGPDDDGDVRLMNAKFKVMLTVKREVRLFTTSTWVGACSRSQARCPAQWLLYGISNPNPEETGCLFVFHQSQNFMHHDVPGATNQPYRTNLWRFDPPVPSNMIHRKLEALEY